MMTSTKKDASFLSKIPIVIPIVLKETAANAIRFENQIGGLNPARNVFPSKVAVKNDTLMMKSNVATKISDHSCATCCE